MGFEVDIRRNQLIFMDEEKGRQKEIREKLESEELDPDEFDEDEQPACAEASAGREELANLL